MTHIVSARISVKGAVKVLVVIVGILVALDLAALAFTMVTGHDRVLGILPKFDLDKERGVGMLFQSWMLLLNAGLFAVVGRARRAEAEKIWGLLCFVFIFLALDEFIVLHETLMEPMRAILGEGAPDFLFFAWVVPYAVLVGALGLWVAPKIFRLPSPAKGLMIGSAVTYVTGALVLEMVGAWWLVRIGGEAARPNFVYEFITTVEETGEMMGLVLLTYGLLVLLRIAHPVVDLRIEE